jgi:hypothetical protein
MMALSFLWAVAVLGVIVPSVQSLLLAGTPHPPFVNHAWLGTALLVGAAVLPLGVGLAGYLVPAGDARPDPREAAREVLRGYLLAPVVSGLLIFLAGVGIARKVRSARHGWSDAHVPIVVVPDGYDDVVRDLHEALDLAGIDVAAEDAPRVMTLPAEILSAVAGPNVRKLRAERLIDLNGPDLRIGVYPHDLAISGTDSRRTSARAVLVSRLPAAARLTTSLEAQKVEDRLKKLARGNPASDCRLGADARAELESIDRTLSTLAVPTDEWDILYRVRLQVERDLLLDAEPGTMFADREPSRAGARVPADAGALPKKEDRPSGAAVSSGGRR